MNREIHARICGSVGVKFPCATRLGIADFLDIWRDPVIESGQSRTVKTLLEKGQYTPVGLFKCTRDAPLYPMSSMAVF